MDSSLRVGGLSSRFCRGGAAVGLVAAAVLAAGTARAASAERPASRASALAPSASVLASGDGPLAPGDGPLASGEGPLASGDGPLPSGRRLRATADSAPGSVTRGGTDEASRAVPREADSAAQLRRARTLRREKRSDEPADRSRARAAAIEAYRAVRLHFPDDSAACAEAAFRAGELLRAADDSEAALAEFEVARERGTHTPFGVRAVLEIGHVHRRAGSFAAALAAYEAVFAREGALPGQRDEAALWIGRVYVDTQRAEDARRTWQRVADGAEDPLDRIRAWDGIAGLSIASGDLEGAAGVLERCRDSLADVSSEETRLGERVRSALAGMRSIDDLARAVTERARAKSDASTSPKKSGDTDLPHRRTDRL